MTYEQIIQKVGKRIIPRVYYYENGNEISIDRDEFQQAKFKYNASLVGTVMCGVELEMKVELPDTEIFIEIEARYGENSQKKVYGGYFRKEDPEYNADAKTYTYEMYDKIIKTMVDYKPINIEYPTTVFDFFKQLIKELELTTNISQLPNGEKVIESDIYDGIEFTYRDVLNDIGQATATLFIVENNEVKKCSFGTSEIVIDDDILKNQNITLGKHFGPINTIVLTRAGESDSIYYPKTLPENPIEFRIAENQLMNENNREEFLEAIYNQLKGIEFDIYDTALVGFGGFDPLAKIKISTGENEYTSYVFNNEITISQGYEETIYTEMPTETSTDYKASDNTDRRINQVYIIVRKLQKEIVAVIDVTNKVEKSINPTGTASGENIVLTDSIDKPLIEMEVEGKSEQFVNEVASTNICPPTTDSRWKFEGGAYLGTNGDVYLPNTNSRAYITIPWDKRSKKMYLVYTISTGGNALVQTAYLDENKAQISGNGSAVADKPDGHKQVNAFGGDNTYGEALGNAKYLVVTFLRDTTYAVNTYSINNVSVSVEDMDYVPFNPKTPTPDEPSEIKSVGFENLFSVEYSSNYGFTYTYENGVYTLKPSVTNPSITFKLSKPILAGTYYYSGKLASEIQLVQFRNSSDVFITSVTGDSYFTSSEDIYFIRYSFNATVNKVITLDFNDTQLAKEKHTYIDFGKTGIEIEATGSNKFNALLIAEGNSNIKINYDGSEITMPINTADNGYTPTNKKLSELAPELKVGDTVFLAFETSYNTTNKFIYLYGPDVLWYAQHSKVITQEMLDSLVCLYANRYSGGETEQLTILNFRMVLGKENKLYQPYQRNTMLIELDEPLRSLPNGIKDIAYIKNNELYVERKVGSVILNGSETWYAYSTGTTSAYKYYTSVSDSAVGLNTSICSHFINHSYAWDVGVIGEYSDHPTLTNKYFLTDKATATDFKTWLSTHNIQLDYELATPIIENYGEIQTLSAIKEYCNITTPGDVKPLLKLKYIKDSELAEYIENHVTELKMTEDQIKQSVETVSNSVDGLTTDINRVEQLTTDNSQVINIISTNIDRTTGDVREVTTTTGFTFNAEGMEINDGSGYKAQHTAQGTFYKDGNTVTGQYTKDGSKQKDLELFGTYSYGKDNINDTPMFVGQLYTDGDGEEGFGHFFNGGGY